MLFGAGYYFSASGFLPNQRRFFGFGSSGSASDFSSLRQDFLLSAVLALALGFRFVRFGFGFGSLRFCFFSFAGFSSTMLCIDPFDECHRCRVALALAKFDDARVTSVAIRRSWRDVVEQLFHRILLPQHRKSGAAGVDRAVFPERHHSFGERTDRFGFGQGGLDPLMFDQSDKPDWRAAPSDAQRCDQA